MQFDKIKEMLQYYLNNARILTQAVNKLSNLIEEKTGGIQYFLEVGPIVACVMKCFRSLYLKENTTPIVPPL